jgi:hypothetical protein
LIKKPTLGTISLSGITLNRVASMVSRSSGGLKVSREKTLFGPSVVKEGRAN